MLRLLPTNRPADAASAAAPLCHSSGAAQLSAHLPGVGGAPRQVPGEQLPQHHAAGKGQGGAEGQAGMSWWGAVAHTALALRTAWQAPRQERRQARGKNSTNFASCASRSPKGIHITLVRGGLPRQDLGRQPARVGGRHAAHHAVLLHQLGQVEVWGDGRVDGWAGD